VTTFDTDPFSVNCQEYLVPSLTHIFTTKEQPVLVLILHLSITPIFLQWVLYLGVQVSVIIPPINCQEFQQAIDRVDHE
jgi:hypothetical protein